MTPLLPVAEALAAMLGHSPAAPAARDVALGEALGAILAEDVVAVIDVPAQDNSAMDGYALRAADVNRPLPVSQRIPAGMAAEPLEPGTAARIFTGAPIPAGADVVVMQEDCREEGGLLVIEVAPAPGDHIRPRGQDLAAGSTVLRAGRRLKPQDLGMLASVGAASVATYRPLKVAVVSTGDELVEPAADVALRPGQLFNSNRYMLVALLERLGMQVIDGGILPDDATATGAAFERLAGEADCIISSGGVSVGEEDHVRAQVERLGELTLWRLAIKPGKPLAFGHVRGTPFIGLPGNPTSSFVTFCLLARPFLLKAQGAGDWEPLSIPVRAGFSVERPGTRQEYLRVSLERQGDSLVARRFANQSSGVLSSVCFSDALAVVPVGAVVCEGDLVEVLLLDSLV